MSDLKVDATLDDADLVFNEGEQFGDLVVDSGVYEYIYIALFGGNREDPGSGTSQFQHWSNLLDNEPGYNLRSQTAYQLNTAEPSNNGLLLLHDAVRNDLQEALNSKLITDLDVVVGWLTSDRVKIELTFTVNFQRVNLIYTPNWEEFRRLRGI